MKTLIIAGVVAVLASGCTPVMNEAVRAGASTAVANARTAEDTNIMLWTTNACGTPLSAAIRNPQIIPALRALCVPGGQDQSPAGLMDTIEDKTEKGTTQ